MSAYLFYLFKNNSTEFEKKFPTSTVEEINHVLSILKAWMKYLKEEGERFDFSFSPVQNSERIRVENLYAFNIKIAQLMAKRKKLYQSKKSLMSRCSLFFKKLTK